ncbi:MAG: pyridoxamine kinase [Lachnospiraceae bacterium]|nr:pyridoxamine kinase [Lachnospiraceae bacterium]
MQYRVPKKIAMFNSFAGYGRCSTTEALPIISAMKVQVCPVPTAIFSNHTGFSSHYCHDFTDYMADYLKQWEKLDLKFDGVYCGFLGEIRQLPIVSQFLAHQRSKGCSMILVDPAMGDHGKFYRTITMEHCNAMKELIRLADIITPNITEACLLTDTPYQDDDWHPEELAQICRQLHSAGPSKIVITGLHSKSPEKGIDSFINYTSIRLEDNRLITASSVSPAAGPSRHGTGDIFASILAADAVKGNDFTASVQKAADFISTCIRASQELDIPETDGVCFENFLDQLDS